MMTSTAIPCVWSRTYERKAALQVAFVAPSPTTKSATYDPVREAEPGPATFIGSAAGIPY
jgi:hypothetical protein